MEITISGKKAIRFILDAVEEKIGNRKCRVCGETIYEDNFGMVDREGFICSKFECMFTVKEKKIYE